jgi:hypothetical protein
VILECIGAGIIGGSLLWKRSPPRKPPRQRSARVERLFSDKGTAIDWLIIQGYTRKAAHQQWAKVEEGVKARLNGLGLTTLAEGELDDPLGF